MIGKSLCFSINFLETVAKSEFHLSTRTFWTKTSSCRSFFSIQSIHYFGEILSCFWWNFLRNGSENCILRVWMNISRKKLEEKVRNFFLGRLIEWYFDVYWEVSSSFLNTAFCLSMGGKLFKAKFFEKNFCCFGMILGLGAK